MMVGCYYPQFINHPLLNKHRQWLDFMSLVSPSGPGVIAALQNQPVKKPECFTDLPCN